MPTKLTQEEFLARCEASQKKSYDFSQAMYLDSKTKVKVICTEHGPFHSVPASLMRGIGCRDCAWENNGIRKRKTQEEFLSDARGKHGDLYTYEQATYVNCDTKVAILCNKCGETFKMTPDAHIHQCQGCPSCSKTGYSGAKSGYLYVLHQDGLTKVGISNNNPTYRCNDINRRAGKIFKVLKFYHFEDGRIPPSIESKILFELRDDYTTCVERFNGAKECFYDVNLAALLNRIEELISQQTKEHHSSNNQAAKAA